MKRTLLVMGFLLVCLAFSSPASAQMAPSRNRLPTHSNPMTLLVTPLRLFVSITNAPATMMGKSVHAILRQVLVGQRRMPGRTFTYYSTARI